MSKRINGISVCNPTVLDREYLLHTVDYAISHGMKHYQFIGPIHNPEIGNVDGMVLYRKYACFNDEKNTGYIHFCMETVNEVCQRLSEARIKTYMWHHELELPEHFKDVYPQILNGTGDVEITHPLVKDFLVNKIYDFFAVYPQMNGLILTLHETRIPLLKLKDQKLSKVERVKYVTAILHDACASIGKELIVRPFASIGEDYEMMTHAYEQISTSMVIMDKWTQFDWSLTLPPNAFFRKIKYNPLLVETDIFGEYFGLGILPIMLRKHILSNYAYCETFSPLGYVSRIDRAGYNAFGDVNEVNYRIMEACQEGSCVEEAIDAFFADRYGEQGSSIRAVMEETEALQRHIFNLKGYYFSEGSRFPSLNHSKNHFYFELMKEEHHLVSGEWFIPIGWKRGKLSGLLEEKQQAAELAARLLDEVRRMQGKLPDADYQPLAAKFANLFYVARIWLALTEVFMHYTKVFELPDEGHEAALETALGRMLRLDEEARCALGSEYYIDKISTNARAAYTLVQNPVQVFANDIRRNLQLEKVSYRRLSAQGLTDFVICGGGFEGHKLMKEVNFSDTYIKPDGICRIPGTYRGKAFSTVNTHGWFSYEIRVRPSSANQVIVSAAGNEGHIDFDLTIGSSRHEIRDLSPHRKDYGFHFHTGNEDTLRIRIDRATSYTPFIYELRVL